MHPWIWSFLSTQALLLKLAFSCMPLPQVILDSQHRLMNISFCEWLRLLDSNHQSFYHSLWCGNLLYLRGCLCGSSVLLDCSHHHLLWDQRNRFSEDSSIEDRCTKPLPFPLFLGAKLPIGAYCHCFSPIQVSLHLTVLQLLLIWISHCLLLVCTSLLAFSELFSHILIFLPQWASSLLTVHSLLSRALWLVSK